MDLRHLASFVAIADSGSFAAAADRLGLTQSAISLHIKALEAATGQTLFDRTHRPPSLTTAGRHLVDPARDILRRCRQLTGAAAPATGPLTLGVVPTALGGLLPATLTRLRADAPDLKVTVTSGLSADLTEQVRQGMLDAALVTEPDALSPGLVWRTLVREPLIVLAPAETTGADDEAVLTAAPFLRFRRYAWAGRLIDRHLTERGIAVDAVVELDSLEAIERLVAAGLGVSVVPYRVGGTVPVGTRALPFGRPTLARTLGLVTRGLEAPSIRSLMAALDAAIPADHGAPFLENR